MSKSGSLAVALSLVVASAASSFALTPEEEAALRDEARALTEQARFQEQQAESAREIAQMIFFAELKKADSQDDQATVKKVVAFQKWLQAGADREARAAVLWDSARPHFFAAYQLGIAAAFIEELAENQSARAEQQRTAADSLLAGSQDEETAAVARDLRRQADKDEREGEAYANEAERLHEQAARKNERAAAIMERAIGLGAIP